MSLELVLPFGDKKSVKNIVFSILSHEYPLKLIDLTNYIRKRYGMSVTFQAVRKAVLQLVDAHVLIQNGKEFSINVSWAKESKQALDILYEELRNNKKRDSARVDSVGSEISVYTFSSLNMLMKFWQDLIDAWFTSFKKSDYPINCYQAGHAWEALLHIEAETVLMSQMSKKGISSSTVITNNSPLDRNIAKFYNRIGVRATINNSQSSFDKSYYVGTYGDMIIQTTYPSLLVKKLDAFFKNNKTLEDFDMSELLSIVNQKCSLKLTVIKNLEMAKQINSSILNQMLD